MATHLIIALGVLGALLDVALHFLQLSDRQYVAARGTAWITLVSSILVGVTLIPQFNLGAAIMLGSVALMAVYALVTGKECH